MIHETLVSKSPLGFQIIQISFPLQVGRLWTEPDVTNGCSLLCCLMFFLLWSTTERQWNTAPNWIQLNMMHKSIVLAWQQGLFSFILAAPEKQIQTKPCFPVITHLLWWKFVLGYVFNSLKRPRFLFYLHVGPDGFVYSIKTFPV